MQQHTAIIIDDERNNRENLHHLLVKHCPSIEVLGEAASTTEALRIIRNMAPQVLFLDIEMPGGNGFDLLSKLGDFKGQVIFVTAYDSYALDAIKFSALDYILKPIDRQELIRAVSKLDNVQQQSPEQINNLSDFLSGHKKRIALNLADEIRFITLDQLVRIEADNNYCHFHMADGEKILCSKHLGHFYEILKSQKFSRVHQSHLINRKYLERFVKRDGGYLVLSNGHQVPVSRTQREHVIGLFTDM